MSFGKYVRARVMIAGGYLMTTTGALLGLIGLVYFPLLIIGVALIVSGIYLYAKGSYLKKQVEPKGVYRVVKE